MGVPSDLGVTPLSAQLPITEDGKLPAVAFVRTINNVVAQLQGQIKSLQSQVDTLQATQQQVSAAQTTANTALTVADSGGVSGAQSGDATLTNLSVGPAPAWTNGPQVDLTGLTANTLTASITLRALSPSASQAFQDTGAYRIQEIIGGVETTVFTGVMQLNAVQVDPTIQRWIETALNNSAAALAAFSSPRSSTGSVSYRLDFRWTSITYTLATAYLYVRRA